MMTTQQRRTSQRGVTLLEGLISTVILLTGMVGVLQGVAIASQQNAMANRHTRASIIAQETLSAVERQGFARSWSNTGLFDGARCVSATSLSAATQEFLGELSPVPASFSAAAGAQGLGWSGTVACYIDLDAVTSPAPLTPAALTPGYSSQDNTTYTRVLAVYRNPANTEITYVALNVGWRDAGRIRIVKRMTALYDTTVNQTNLEF